MAIRLEDPISQMRDLCHSSSALKRIGLAGLAVSIMAACSDSGYKGELATKPIYGDLSGNFYEEMCHGKDEWTSDGLTYADGRSRSVKIQMDSGKCAVLYLDGVERDGSLMVYPWRKGELPACHGLKAKLAEFQAHQTVKAKVDGFCSG
ncbi:hypothetical protein [Stenotrophomonas sp.]|uniref:hypothetical protein n=1 Tax=Stenotrophomonas sp. TaxID=69392 RepID=UPI0028987697|nr:hypothetical protein [Stenotrophomonas sp.]